MTFEDLNLIPALLKAVRDQNYTEPTSIQAKSIPLVLNGDDVLGSAQTGTGKTAAFAIPIIQHIVKDKNQSNGRRKVLSLIVTPTRELAIQIGENIRAYAKYTDIKSTVIFGGVKQGSQTQALNQGVDILIATPGRLLDLMDQGYISLADVKYFVLDEADRMLDMGFINDIKKLLAKLPKQRQSLFFSATMPNKILSLSREILIDPKKVAVDTVSSTADTIQQYIYTTNKDCKNKLLLHILKNPDLNRVLLFSRTKHGADRIVRNLQKKNIKGAAIHGDKAQNQRQKALSQFKAGQIRVLVATDIAARGIDIDKLRYVINFDIPNEPETYVHRIGRCGRAGEEGIAISICEPEENVFVKDIEKLIKRSINVISDNPFPQTDRPMNDAERKEAAREKERKKQEFFANRKKNKHRRR
ncbi:MAG: DEAD/DEAH box helicase [Flavobacteriales bacterium]|nr:MAG: DEAD/DEAH box helicase [Flavobacteriales bacterium]